MPGIASAATAVLIGHVAGGTTTIRVGAGGVMLPNHAPLVIAEQFGTLESLYPGRIDLGLGRAPGTDPSTMRALRRDARATPRTVSATTSSSCMRYFAPARSRGRRSARFRARGLHVPDLAPRLEPLQRAARGGARAAVRVRVALRAGSPAGGARQLYRSKFRPSDALAAAVRDGRRQRLRGGHGRRGAAALHVARSSSSSTCGAAARVRCTPPVESRRRACGRRRSRPGIEHALAYAVRRLAGDGAQAA